MILGLSQELSREHEIHIVCPRPVQERSDEGVLNATFHYTAIDEVSSYPIPEKFGLNVQGLRLLARMLFATLAIFATTARLSSRVRFDVTCLTNRYVAVPILLAMRRRNRGVFVFSEQNIWPWLYPAPSRGWARLRFLANVWFGRAACVMSDAVHANSDSLRVVLLNQGLEETRVAAISNGVDVDAHNADPLPLSEPLVVAFVGRLVEDKGVRILADTIRGMNEMGKRVRFVVLGDGPLRAFLLTRGGAACELLGNRSRDEVLTTLRSAHVTLFLSPVENVPSLALLEALALGKAVIATRVGDTPRFLSDGQNALLCDPDPVSVALAITRLSEDRDLYSTVANGAKKLAAAYSWEEVARKHLALYTSLVPSAGV